MVGTVDASFVARTFAPASTQGVSSRLKSAASALTPAQTRQVEDLKARDREVRDHEQAHINAGGGLIRGGPSYTYETGPDGKRYAVGGDVSIDVSPGRDAADTIRRAQQIRDAALAPAQPSSQDYSVAAQAAAMQAEAQTEAFQTKKAEPAGATSSVAAGALKAYRAAQDAFAVTGQTVAAYA